MLVHLVYQRCIVFQLLFHLLHDKLDSFLRATGPLPKVLLLLLSHIESLQNSTFIRFIGTVFLSTEGFQSLHLMLQPVFVLLLLYIQVLLLGL